MLNVQDWGMLIGVKATMKYTNADYTYTGIITGVFTDKDMTDHIVLDHKIHTGKDAKPHLIPLDKMSQVHKEMLIDMLDKSIDSITICRVASGAIIAKVHFVDADSSATSTIYVPISAIKFIASLGYDVFGYLDKGLAIEVADD